MILFPPHRKSQLPDLTSHTISLQPVFTTTSLPLKAAWDFKTNLPPFLSSHILDLLHLPPCPPSFSPPTQTALSLKDPWVTNTALECWELRYKDAACSPNSRRREGVERRGKSALGVFDLAGLVEALQAEFICWALAVSRHCCYTVGNREVEYCIPSQQRTCHLHWAICRDLERGREKWREKERKRESTNYL